MSIFFSPSTGGFYDDEINASIPDDAVEITSDLRWSLVACLNGGGSVRIDADGMPQAVAPVPLSLDQVKAALCAQVDSAADATYAAIAGDNPGRLNEYEWAKSEADAFKAAGYAGAVPESIACWVDGKAAAGITWTPQQACDDIIGTAGAWLSARAANRRARLVGKGQVMAAVDEASAQATADAAIGNIRAIAEGI